MVSTIDILPTMLRAARLPVPEELPGIALQDIESGRIPSRQYIHTFTTGSSPNLLYLQFGIRDQRYKLVYSPERALNRLAESRYANSQLPLDQRVQASFVRPSTNYSICKKTRTNGRISRRVPRTRRSANASAKHCWTFNETSKNAFRKWREHRDIHR